MSPRPEGPPHQQSTSKTSKNIPEQPFKTTANLHEETLSLCVQFLHFFHFPTQQFLRTVENIKYAGTGMKGGGP